MNTVETFHPRSPAEEVSLHLSSITMHIETLAQQLRDEHEEALEQVIHQRQKDAEREAKVRYHEVTEATVTKVLESMLPISPSLQKLGNCKQGILTYASHPKITASLKTLPGQLARTTHPIARVAQAIMSHVGLHFTSPGHTTRLVDTHQQPNTQAVKSHL